MTKPWILRRFVARERPLSVAPARSVGARALGLARSSALAWAAETADLSGRTWPAVNLVAAPVAGGAALDALGCAISWRALRGPALAWSAAAAYLRRRARPAVDCIAAAISGRAALQILRGAIDRRAHKLTAHTGLAAAAARLTLGAGTTIVESPASVGGRAAHVPEGLAVLGRANGHAALARPAGPANLARRTRMAIEGSAAAVPCRAAFDALRHASGRGADRFVWLHAGTEIEEHELEDLLLRAHWSPSPALRREDDVVRSLHCTAARTVGRHVKVAE